MEAMGLPSPFFLFYSIVDIFIRFLDTDLSLLICLSEIEVRTEGNRLRDWRKLFVKNFKNFQNEWYRLVEKI